MELSNNGHIGGRDLVLYREVVPTQKLTSKSHPSIPKFNLLWGVACGRSNQWFYVNMFKSTQDGANRLNKRLSQLSRCRWVTISQLHEYHLRFRGSVCSWRMLIFIQFTVAWGHLFVCYPKFRHCPYLGGWKCVSFMVLNQEHVVHVLCRGWPLLRGSVTGSSTVHTDSMSRDDPDTPCTHCN